MNFQSVVGAVGIMIAFAIRAFPQAPTIISIYPTSATIGETVTITGTNFTNVTAVTFGGFAAYTYGVSPNQITAVVNTGGSGSVFVQTTAGSASLPGFTYVTSSPPSPSITSISPTSGVRGTIVTITGDGFMPGATQVRFGWNWASTYVNSSNMITATVTGDSSGYVFVRTPIGQTTSTDYFANAASSQPTISSFSPMSATVGETVTITGTNFTGATGVFFSGISPASFTVDSPTQIRAVVKWGATGDVSVRTPGGTAYLPGFTFIPSSIPAPNITGYSPNTGGPGTIVNIAGTNFTGATIVRFGGTDASSFTVNSPTSITATVGAGSSGIISVETPYGAAGNGYFTYTLTPPSQLPTITSFSPTSATIGQTVTITGTNFTGTSQVTFSGISAASFIVDSPTTIRAVVKFGATGPVGIQTPNGYASLPGFTFVPASTPAPVLTGSSPASGGPGTVVSITGTDLTGATIVTFGGTNAASFIVNSSTSITATVGNGSTGNIFIETPFGRTFGRSFSFTPPPAPADPSITSFAPTSGRPGDVVTITGANFQNTSDVTFSGISAAALSIDSPTSIRAIVANGGSGFIHVLTNPSTGPFIDGFKHLGTPGPIPTVTSFSPTSGPEGTIVTIKGTDFDNATAVHFGVTSADWFLVNSPTVITARVAKGMSGNVVVTTKGGVGYKKVFAFDPGPPLPQSPAPQIRSISPAQARIGDNVTIAGENFTGTLGVTFGGVSAQSFTINSANQITAIVGNKTGDVGVFTPGGVATFAAGTVTAVEPSSTGLSLYPNPCERSGKFNLSINSLDASSRTTLEVINIHGQPITMRNVVAGTNSWDAAEIFPAVGIYIVAVRNGASNVYMKYLVRE